MKDYDYENCSGPFCDERITCDSHRIRQLNKEIDALRAENELVRDKLLAMAQEHAVWEKHSLCEIVKERDRLLRDAENYRNGMKNAEDEAAKLRGALAVANEFCDFLGDSDNGPPSWMSEQYYAFEAALRKVNAQAEKKL